VAVSTLSITPIFSGVRKRRIKTKKQIIKQTSRITSVYLLMSHHILSQWITFTNDRIDLGGE